MTHRCSIIGSRLEKERGEKKKKKTLEAIKRNLGRIVTIRIVVKLKTKEKV